jgi:hypothetical protein
MFFEVTYLLLEYYVKYTFRLDYTRLVLHATYIHTDMCMHKETRLFFFQSTFLGLFNSEWKYLDFIVFYQLFYKVDNF